MKYIAKELGIITAFVVCVYCGFHYQSGFAFLGAIIAFFSLGNKYEDSTPPEDTNE